MWEFFGKVVDSLPPWFLMALIVFFIAAALYLLPRLRRDKNGRLYLFSRSYEYQKKRVKELFASVGHLCGDVTEIRGRMESAECESLKQSFYLALLPKDERLIAGLKYVHRGGNGPVRKDVAIFVKDNPDVYADVIARYPQWAFAGKG
jgi:hypothetical protein